MSTTTADDPLASSGSLFLSITAQVLFQGILISQSSEYFTDYWTDSFGLKSLVALTMIFSALQTASLLVIGWSTFVTSLGSQVVYSPDWVLAVQPVLAGSICALVQSFLIRRCWKILDRRLVVAITLGLLLVLSMLSSIFWTVCFGLFGSTTTKHVVKDLAISWAVFSLILNLTITIIISAYLIQHRTGLAHLDALLRKVSRFTWESSLLPSLCMFAALCIAILPTDNIAIGICMAVAAKLECVALMRTLNARAKLRAQAISANALCRQSLDITAIPGYANFEPTPSPTSATSEAPGDPPVEEKVTSMKHYLNGRTIKLRSLEDVIRREIYDEPGSSDAEAGPPSSSNSSPRVLQSFAEVLQSEHIDPLELPGSRFKWSSKRSKLAKPTPLALPSAHVRADSDPSPVAGPSNYELTIRARQPTGQPPHTP